MSHKRAKEAADATDDACIVRRYELSDAKLSRSCCVCILVAT